MLFGHLKLEFQLSRAAKVQRFYEGCKAVARNPDLIASWFQVRGNKPATRVRRKHERLAQIPAGDLNTRANNHSAGRIHHRTGDGVSV